MTLSVDSAAVSPRAEGPERCGRPRQVQTDVPEGVYRRGNTATEGEGRSSHDSVCVCVFGVCVVYARNTVCVHVCMHNKCSSPRPKQKNKRQFYIRNL